MTVSVCIPTYNQEKFIEQAVRSAYNQTFKPVEIVVSDDSSNDNTGFILRKLQDEIPILKVIWQETNQGITKNVNTCLRGAQGDLIVRLDSDDILHKTYIENFVPLFKSNDNIGFGHCSIQEIDSNGNNRKLRDLFRKEGIQNSNDALKEAIDGYKVAANIIIFRRKALEEVGFIKSTINFAEDYYLACSISDFGYDNAYLKRRLASYRVWSDQGKLRSRRKLSEIMGLVAVYDEVLKPAFLRRNWPVKRIEIAKEKLAIRQADCLGWEVYSLAEKREIEAELSKLSNSLKARFFYYLHLHRLGSIVSLPKSVKNKLKMALKSFLFKKQVQ